jgi:hypothetical protein
MTTASTSKSKTFGVLRSLALFLAMLISGGNLLFPRPLILAAMFCIFGLLFAHQMNVKPRGYASLIFVLLGTIFALSFYHAHSSGLLPTLVRFANFAAGLMLLQLYLRTSRAQLTRDLTILLKPMAIQAILTPLLAIVAAPLFLPIIVQETTYQSFLLLFNYHVTLEDATGLVRPDGLFYEPGVFQIYLNLYLYLVLYELHDWRRVPIAFLAVLATQSTTGIVISMALLGLAVYRSSHRISMKRKLPAMIAASLVAIPMCLFAIENISGKLFGDMRGSSLARQYDLLTGLNVIAEHPILGIGFDHANYKEIAGRLGFQDTELDEHITEDRGNTNGLIFLLYSIGIPLSMAFFWGIFNQQFFANKFIVGIMLFLSFISESMILTPFFLLIILSGLVVRQNFVALVTSLLRIRTC